MSQEGRTCWRQACVKAEQACHDKGGGWITCIIHISHSDKPVFTEWLLVVYDHAYSLGIARIPWSVHDACQLLIFEHLVPTCRLFQHLLRHLQGSHDRYLGRTPPRHSHQWRTCVSQCSVQSTQCSARRLGPSARWLTRRGGLELTATHTSLLDKLCQTMAVPTSGRRRARQSLCAGLVWKVFST